MSCRAVPFILYVERTFVVPFVHVWWKSWKGSKSLKYSVSLSNKVKKAFSNEMHAGNYGNGVTIAVTGKDPCSHICITIYNEICLLP